MGDIKLFILDFIIQINFVVHEFLLHVLNFLSPILEHAALCDFGGFAASLNQNMTFFFALKFCVCIGFLILIRGGAPRYRYDYLTKLGWLKFLGLVLSVFLFTLSLFSLY